MGNAVAPTITASHSKWSYGHMTILHAHYCSSTILLCARQWCIYTLLTCTGPMPGNVCMRNRIAHIAQYERTRIWCVLCGPFYSLLAIEHHIEIAQLEILIASFLIQCVFVTCTGVCVCVCVCWCVCLCAETLANGPCRYITMNLVRCWSLVQGIPPYNHQILYSPKNALKMLPVPFKCVTLKSIAFKSVRIHFKIIENANEKNRLA